MGLIRNIRFLSILFILGACSSEPGSTDSKFKSSGNDVLDAGTSDALDRLGAVTGMTQHEKLSKPANGPEVENRFFSQVSRNTGTFKTTSITSYDGTIDGKTFDNEVVSKSATEGSTTSTATFKLTENLDPAAEIADKKGYTTLFALTPTKIDFWESVKADGTGEWITQDLVPTYFIVKDEGNKRYMIAVAKNESKEVSYKIIDAIDDKNASIYEKK